MVVVESAGITDVGKKRKSNEDSLFMDDRLGLYVVADGMGGHLAGEVASELVVATIRDTIRHFVDDPYPDTQAPWDESLSGAANRLLTSIHAANRGVFQAAKSKDAYHGMGATVAAVYITDQAIIAANVGDSPIFLIHNNAIEQLSVTHNVVTEQAMIDPNNVARLGDDVKFLLTRAMGIDETVRPDICEVPFFRGDSVVIGSDGLTDLVLPEEIRDVVRRQPAAGACRELVDMANGRGGHDNITVIVLNAKEVKKRGGLGVFRSRLVRRLIRFLHKYD